MNITLVFFVGLFSAAIGTALPGILNISAAKISLKDGYGKGIMFSLGACLIFAVQTTIAVVFAKYLNSHRSVIEILQRVVFVLFILISIYFFFIAGKHEKQQTDVSAKSSSSRFFQGMLLSGFNMLTIPFHAYLTITIANFGWLHFSTTEIATYVSAAVTGTFSMLYMYIFFFERIKDKAFTSQKSMNKIIGIVTALVAVITLIHIIKEF